MTFGTANEVRRPRTVLAAEHYGKADLMAKRAQGNLSRVSLEKAELDRLLDALTYIVCQRQMRLRWGPARVGSPINNGR